TVRAPPTTTPWTAGSAWPNTAAVLWAQVAVLRPYLRADGRDRPGDWIARSLGGLAAGGLPAALLACELTLALASASPGGPRVGLPALLLALPAALVGTGIGPGQWSLLRRLFPRAGWWIAGDVAGLLAGEVCGALIALTVAEATGLANITQGP